jgi:hypothetical protein
VLWISNENSIDVIGEYTADREERFLDFQGKAVPL